MNYDVIAEQGRVPIKMWTRGVEVDHNSLNQLRNIASLPFIYKHVAVMPDVHLGIGATVGSVIPTKGAIIPSAVGVDIGCGMIAARTELTASDLPDNLSWMRTDIEKAVPVGFGEHKHQAPGAALVWEQLCPRLRAIAEKYPKIERGAKGLKQLGTLGGGNHFIEVCLDEEQRVWIMLHSGSRGIGNIIGTYFISLAREDMRIHFINLPDRDLAYFPEGTEHFREYVDAVAWAQEYALRNRDLMLTAVTAAVARSLKRDVLPTEIAANCHHNYVRMENHFGENVYVTRKGAVSAREGEMGIIPGSMGTRSYIVRGKGESESFTSCSHGAGRRFSRGEAKRRITLEDHKKATEGVECRKDSGVIDESPSAYKDIDAVIAAESDLIEVVHTLKQVLCVKG